MGFLDKLLGRKQSEVVVKAGETLKFVSGYEPVFSDWAGEVYESMLVRAAIDARSRHISKLKIEFLTEKDDLLLKNLKIRPNRWNTWSQFLYRVNTILDCCNNCFIVPIYNDKLQKVGIFPVLPSQCKVVTYKDELWVRYSYMSGRETAACKLSECVLLVKFQFKNDFFGTNNSALDDTMSLIDIQTQGIKEAIKSTAGYKFMAKMTNFSKLEDLNAERENFSESVFGKEAKQKGGLLLFPNTFTDINQIDLKPFTPDKDQMELIQKNVYDYFGVNEKILQNSANGDEWSSFFEGAVEPFAIQFSETLTSALFTDEEIEEGNQVLATANRIAHMNFADKLSYVQGLTDRGLLSINEAREVFNLRPLDGDAGNVMPRRGEYALLDSNTGTDLDTKEETDV